MIKFSVENLTFTHTETDYAIHNINFELKQNEICCIIGPSGAGKSSLFKVIAGLLKADSGKVMINNRDVTKLVANERKIGFVSQNPSLLPHLNILNNILLPIEEKNKAKFQEKALNYLELLKLTKYQYKYPNQLSIGQQQKISIIRSFIASPDLILFDEPYANLDFLNKEILIKETMNFLKHNSSIKIFISHNPNDALHIADKILVMENGTITQFASYNEIYNNPKSYFAFKLFNEINEIKLNKAKIYFRISDCFFTDKTDKNCFEVMIIDKKMINDEYEYLCQNAELEFINIKSNESFDKGDKKYIKYTKSFSF